MDIGHCSSIIDLTSFSKSVPLGTKIEYLEDITNNITIEQVSSGELDSEFNEHQKEIINYSFSNSKFWFRFIVSNTSKKNHPLVLESTVSWIEYFDLFKPDENGKFERVSRGLVTLPSERNNNHYNPVFELIVPPESSRTYYISVAGSHSLLIPLTLWKADEFWSMDQKRRFYFGLFYGALSLIFIYNLFLTVFLNSRTYLYYCLHVLFFGLFMYSLEGLVSSSLSLDNRWFAIHALTFFPATSQFFSALFCLKFLSIKKARNPGIYYALRFLQLAAMMVMISSASSLIPYSFTIQTMAILTLIYPFVVFVSALIGYFQKLPSASYFLISWTVFCISILYFGTTLMGLSQQNIFTTYSMYFGSIFEITLLSIALANRIQLLRNESEESNRLLLESQYQATTNLENLVSERTKSLGEANRELERMSMQDSLTQVHNRRSFDKLMDGKWREHLRSRQPLSLIMLDIDFFKQYNDTYGHPAGDDCLVKIANALQTVLRRPSDILARYGGEEFVAVIAANEEIALNIANKLKMAVDNLELEHSASTKGVISISQGLITRTPTAGDSVDEMIKLADLALYESKSHGRDRCTVSKQEFGSNHHEN